MALSYWKLEEETLDGSV